MSVEDKLDRIIEIQHEQKITLVAMETDLRHHIKRSDAHEVRIEKQDKIIGRLWYAVFALAGTGAGASGPSLFKWLGSIL